MPASLQPIPFRGRDMTTEQGDNDPFTKTPNAFYDQLLAEITSLCELKVTLALIRKTHGHHKTEDQISISQLEDMTRLSRQGVIDGIELGLKRGTIRRRKSGQYYLYSLKLVNDLDQSTNQTSQPNRLEVVNDLDQLPPKLVNDLDTQKKEEQKKERKKESKAAMPQSPPANVEPNPINTHRKVTNFKNLNQVQRETINLVVTDLLLWEKVLIGWMAAGHRPNNVEGQLDWYKEGKTSNGKPITTYALNGKTNGFSRPPAEPARNGRWSAATLAAANNPHRSKPPGTG